MNLQAKFHFSGNNKNSEGMRSLVFTRTNLPWQHRSLSSSMLENRVDEHVELDKYVNEPTRVSVKCCASYPWLFFSSYDSRTKDFVVKNYNPLHKYNGDHVKEFGRILNYRDELLRTKPGTTCVVRLSKETHEDGRKMFVAFYICFDALKKAFLDGCRRCIGFDGYFLKGVCKGQLLVVVCKDGNNQILPLAWAIVEVENTFYWRWFVKLLKNDLELGDGTKLTVITDMQKRLDKAMSEILPQVEHRMCARHILANWSKIRRDIERRNYFWRCARSIYEQELKKNLDHIEKIGDKIVEDLLYYNKERWCKVYFKYFSNCDSVDNNMAETFNSWILGPSHKTIIIMLEEIRVKMMIRIAQMRDFYDTWISDISPMAVKVLQENTSKSIKCVVHWNGQYSYEVKEGHNSKHIVNLNRLTCTCRAWILKGIPCAHVVAAIHFKKLEPVNYIAHWYHRETYMKTYSHFLQHIQNMEMWPQSQNPSVIPPEVRVMLSRAKKVRRKEPTENKTGKLSKRGTQITYNNCHTKGHNKKGCQKTTQGTARSAGGAKSSSIGSSSTHSVQSDITTGIGRGTPYKRPRMVGMRILQTKSGPSIYNKLCSSDSRYWTQIKNMGEMKSSYCRFVGLFTGNDMQQ
ncbi:uncharacterized protein [Nicotiana tomentosiformis]|uniref:uncharacterized protein n=1 Tax=Nicotiana tomentosiformis TaxID=4098 RepID=UPI00388C92A1